VALMIMTTDGKRGEVLAGRRVKNECCFIRLSSVFRIPVRDGAIFNGFPIFGREYIIGSFFFSFLPVMSQQTTPRVGKKYFSRAASRARREKKKQIGLSTSTVLEH